MAVGITSFGYYRRSELERAQVSVRSILCTVQQVNVETYSIT